MFIALDKRLLTGGFIVFFTVLLSGCMGYVPGGQSYWDAQVEQMCAKDGGVHIFEKLAVTREDIKLGRLPMSADGRLGVTFKESAHAEAPAYAERELTYLREKNPAVTRVVSNIIRRKDGSVIARQISYSRLGGDFPGPTHGTVFRCPDASALLSQMQALFVIEE